VPLDGLGEDTLGDEEELIDPYNVLTTEQKTHHFCLLTDDLTHVNAKILK
tara:strand:+ start:217 stop:366 length:150 start_codon:yes stop_codon:yes gene_type:complete